jgi:hypothetical protein
MPVNKITNMRVYEIFEKVAEVHSQKQKAEILRQYNNRAVRDVLKGAFDDTVQFVLPEGTPPYTPGSSESPGSSLLKQSKKFRYFVVSSDRSKSDPKVEKIFIQLLESIHPKDAEIVVKMKDKDLKGMYHGLTKKLVQDAFPGLIQE